METPWRVCRVCGVFEPFADLTDLCCLQETGAMCIFDDARDPPDDYSDSPDDASDSPLPSDDAHLAGEERRRARDGNWYTVKEFKEFYGWNSADYWNSADIHRAGDGSALRSMDALSLEPAPTCTFKSISGVPKAPGWVRDDLKILYTHPGARHLEPLMDHPRSRVKVPPAQPKAGYPSVPRRQRAKKGTELPETQLEAIPE